MNPTIYREACGTHRGMIIHQAAGEEPCGACRSGEKLRRLEAETIPEPPPRRPGPASATETLPPVTPAQAAANRRLLEAELTQYERARGHLRIVNDPPGEGAA